MIQYIRAVFIYRLIEVEQVGILQLYLFIKLFFELVSRVLLFTKAVDFML